MLEPLVKDIKNDLRPWEDVSDVLGQGLSEKVTANLQSLILKVEDAAGPSRGVLEPYFAELRLKVDEVDEICKTGAEEVERGLVHIKNCIISSEDARLCYFVQALEKTYNECGAMAGSGVRQKRMDKFAAKLSQKGAKNPFHQVHDKAKSATQDLVRTHTKLFTEKISGIFAKLHDMFMRYFTTDDEEIPEAKALRKQLRNQLPDFQSQIAECERLIQKSVESESKQKI